MNPTKIVSYYAENLNIKKRTLNSAIFIIEKAKMRRSNLWKLPFSIVATATYLACLAENEKVTQEDIGKIFGVT